jgi:hypothetical protein
MRQIAVLILLSTLGLCLAVSCAVAQAWGPLFGPKRYVQTAGTPNVYTEAYLALPGQGLLTIQNGTTDGTGRVSGARITINGKEVVGPEAFKRQTAIIKVVIDLVASNSISTELTGQPESHLTVDITQTTLKDASLPTPLICRGPAWDTQTPSRDSIVYACKEACSNWRDCTYTMAKEIDRSGCPLPHLAFVVDGMAGQLRWSCDGQKTVFLHVGGAGTSWWIDRANRQRWRDLEADGVRLVEIKWERGVMLPATLVRRVPVGWFSRTDAHGTTIRRLTGRPGALMKWAHDNLASGNTYGTLGCSGGGQATYSPVYWYPAELVPILNYQFLSGGALSWDLEEWCGVTAAPLGLCEHNPLVSCRTDAQCGGGANRCGFSRVSPNVAYLVDYILASGWFRSEGSCQQHLPNPAYRINSYRFTPGSYEYRHLIDFQVSEGSSSGEEDNGNGAVVSQGFVFAQLPGPKRWFDDQPFGHCQSISDPALVTMLQRVRQGLGILP